MLKPNLDIAAGKVWTLTNNPGDANAQTLRVINVSSLQDLIKHNFVSDPANLQKLLQSAKEATRLALSSRQTFVPFNPVTGTTRPDLGRFGFYTAGVANVRPSETTAVWRMVRGLEPQSLLNLTITQQLPKFDLYAHDFNDLTVGGTLLVTAGVQLVTCKDLVIEKGGMVTCQGSHTVIQAFSIEGKQ